MSYPENREGTTEFDKLCATCKRLFDGNTIWDKEELLEGITQPFHNINSLSRSANLGCHICNLLLSQISSGVTEQLQHDLDDSVVTSSQQMQISLWCGIGEWYLSLLAMIQGKHKFNPDLDYSKIGQLLIRSAEGDRTNESRSTEHWNCSSSMIAQISRWLEQCRISHMKCFDAQSTAATRELLPTRLLDLRPATAENYIKLVRAIHLPKDTLYATLSHCWGGRCDTTLTAESLQSFEKGLSLNSIPRTFQDAVSVTARLGVRYLWIDALCIVQDSKDDLDWKQEASIMGDVYANSFFTLAATASIDSRGGLLQKRNPLATWPCRVMAKWWEDRGPLQVVVKDHHDLGPKMEDLPLGTRAWAFQEWLLSKRLVHFSRYEVRWECYCLAASEVYPTGLDIDYLVRHHQYHEEPTKNIIAIMADPSHSAQALWWRIRSEYSGKALTNTSDKLAAFSGIARMAFKVLKSPSSDYLAGMWKPHLLTELLWERSDHGDAHCTSDLYIAPTWSWASLNGAVSDPGRLSIPAESQRHSEVLDAQVTPVDDAFGPVKAGSLTLRTWLCQIDIQSPEKRYSRTITQEPGWRLLAINGIAVSYAATISIDRPSPEMGRFSVLLSFDFIPIRSVIQFDRQVSLRGILLQGTGKKRGQYYRLGVLRFSIDDSKGDEGLLQLDVVKEQGSVEPTSYLDYPVPGVKAIEIV